MGRRRRVVSRVRARAAPREIQTEKVRVLRGARVGLVACVDQPMMKRARWMEWKMR